MTSQLYTRPKGYNRFMLELNIPGRGWVQLEHLVLDVSGTIALDGQLMEGLRRILGDLRDRLDIHLITADTHGRVAIIAEQLNLPAVRLQSGDESQQKAAFVQELGADKVVAIGQGANDAAMLKAAQIGICVLSREGTSTEAILAADLVALDIYTALELLEKPLRLVATLRK